MMSEAAPQYDVIIEFRDVHKSFGGNYVHRGIDLAIYRGETITLIGGSGQGKTVLLKELTGLMYPDQGRVFVEGREVSRMREKQLLDVRKDVGFLFQGSALFDSMNVRGNIAYPLYEHFKYDEETIDKIVTEKLKLVGLGDPEVQGLMPAELSGGMRKRVGLARAIATDPKIIIYDEPTTGLDPTNVARINKMIVDLQRKLGVTSIAVTHDMESTFQFTDRIAMLWKGKIIGVGAPDEMRNSENDIIRQFIDGTLPMDDI